MVVMTTIIGLITTVMIICMPHRLQCHIAVRHAMQHEIMSASRHELVHACMPAMN